RAPFDLGSDLPVRFTLFPEGDDEHLLLVVFHHIAVDVWSQAPFLRDLVAAYRARTAGRPPERAPGPVLSGDCAAWQRELRGSAVPVRFTLFREGEDERLRLVVLHHIAVDEWSQAPFLRDLDAAYRARTAGRAPEWAPVPVQYGDYAAWQRELLGDADDPQST